MAVILRYFDIPVAVLHSVMNSVLIENAQHAEPARGDSCFQTDNLDV